MNYTTKKSFPSSHGFQPPDFQAVEIDGVWGITYKNASGEWEICETEMLAKMKTHYYNTGKMGYLEQGQAWSPIPTEIKGDL